MKMKSTETDYVWHDKEFEFIPKRMQNVRIVSREIAMTGSALQEATQGPAGLEKGQGGGGSTG